MLIKDEVNSLKEAKSVLDLLSEKVLGPVVAAE